MKKKSTRLQSWNFYLITLQTMRRMKFKIWDIIINNNNKNHNKVSSNNRIFNQNNNKKNNKRMNFKMTVNKGFQILVQKNKI